MGPHSHKARDGHEESFLQRIHPHAERSISQPWGAVSRETWGDAQGHLDYLKQVGDPATGLPIGDSVLNLKAAIAGETHEYTDMYPGMVRVNLAGYERECHVPYYRDAAPCHASDCVSGPWDVPSAFTNRNTSSIRWIDTGSFRFRRASACRGWAEASIPARSATSSEITS